MVYIRLFLHIVIRSKRRFQITQFLSRCRRLQVLDGLINLDLDVLGHGALEGLAHGLPEPGHVQGFHLVVIAETRHGEGVMAGPHLVAPDALRGEVCVEVDHDVGEELIHGLDHLGERIKRKLMSIGDLINRIDR